MDVAGSMSRHENNLPEDLFGFSKLCIVEDVDGLRCAKALRLMDEHVGIQPITRVVATPMRLIRPVRP